MQHKITTILAIICLPLFVTSQKKALSFEFKDYSFDDSEIIVPPVLSNENEIVLQKDIKIELISDKDDVRQYYLLHEKILLNSNDAIERNNRVYIPFRVNEQLLTNKLRVILENGQIIELQPSDIKEEVNEEKGLKYNYYAVNGLQKGAIIEKLFIIEESPEIKGKTITLQGNYPIVNASIELIYPSHLDFKFKSYNGLSEAEVGDKVYSEEKGSILLKDSNIMPIPDDETYANDVAHAKFFRYKLQGNKASGAFNLNNYREFASNVYENLHVELDKKDEKKLADFVKDIPKANTEDEQIRNIEYKIKTQISYNKYFEGNSTFIEALTTKQSSELHLLQLYVAILQKYNIEKQLVVTSKRFVTYFDKDFESIEQLADVLIYFPKSKKYLEPAAVEYRYPLFNFNYGNNYGLFIKEKEFGGAKMGIGEVGWIDIASSVLTHDYTDIDIDLSQDPSEPTIHTVHKQSGYSASNYQIIKDYVPNDRYEEITSEIAENFTQKAPVKNKKIINGGSENIGKNPFIIDVTFNGKDLVQKAGSNYLCNVGVLIGSQMELYQVEKRVLPVEIYFPHYYTRNIKIKMPKGYVLKNPEVFDMKYSTVIDGKTMAYWESSAKVINDEIMVSNTEYYDAIEYPLSVFDDYKKVVNAAADFNKIVVVVGPKE